MKDECRCFENGSDEKCSNCLRKETILSAPLEATKDLVDILDVADLRTIEDYAQLRRIRLQEVRLCKLKGVDYICPF